MGEGTYRDKIVEIVSKQQSRRNFTGAEVGVADGKTSERLLRAYDNLTMHLVDPWIGDLPEWCEYVQSGDNQAIMTGEQKRLQMIGCVNRLKFAAERFAIHPVTSVDGAKRVPDNSLHFVLIDAIHTRGHVREDTQVWLPKLARGGVMIWHDYGNPAYPGVGQAVRAFTRKPLLQCNTDLFLAWTVIK